MFTANIARRLDCFLLHDYVNNFVVCAEMSDNKDEKMDEESKYGSCEGPDAMYVKLISSDGHEFIVKREHALTSGTIKAMLSGPGKTGFDIFSKLLVSNNNGCCNL